MKNQFIFWNRVHIASGSAFTVCVAPHRRFSWGGISLLDPFGL